MRALIILLILAASGYWWHYRRERFNEMEALQSDQKNIDRSIAERQQDIQRVKATLEPLRKNQEQTEAPGGSPERLEKEIDELKESLKTAAAQLDEVEADFTTAVEARRDYARKQTFPVVKLPSGEELVECTITKFGEGYLSISHREGIKKVESEDLPEGWAEKYAVDYVSREAQAEKQAMIARVEEAVVPPLDLKNVQLSELDAKIDQLNAQLLELSAQMRAATRKSDELIRDAYRIALDKGQKGEQAAAKRTAMFRQSKVIEQTREEVRKKYRSLREQKLALERQRLELRRKRVSASVP
jgi:seryl-tRNA synthetase